MVSKKSCCMVLLYRSRRYDKYFCPPTISSIVAFPTSRDDSYFSPYDLVTALSPLAQLESLTLGFYSPSPSSMKHPPAQCTALPSLTFLDFHCSSEYLEDFLARICLPSLRKITVKIFNQIFFEIPRFCQLISRLNALGLLTLVFVTHSVESVSVTLVNENVSLNTSCVLKTSCTWLVKFVAMRRSRLPNRAVSLFD